MSASLWKRQCPRHDRHKTKRGRGSRPRSSDYPGLHEAGFYLRVGGGAALGLGLRLRRSGRLAVAGDRVTVAGLRVVLELGDQRRLLPGELRELASEMAV